MWAIRKNGSNFLLPPKLLGPGNGNTAMVLRRPLTNNWHLCRQISQTTHHGAPHGDLLATVVDGMEGGAGASIWRVAAHPCAHMVSPWDMSATSASNFTDLVPQISIHPAMVNVWWWCQFMVWRCCSPSTAALLPPWKKASYGLLSSSAGATHAICGSTMAVICSGGPI